MSNQENQKGIHINDEDDLERLQELGYGKEVTVHETKLTIQVHDYEGLATWFKVFGQANKVEVSEEMRDNEEELARVAEEENGFFAIVGPAGTGKTQHMKRAVSDATLYIEGGKVSPLGLYTGLYDHRNDKKVVIDDAESILQESDGRNLAKGLCQTCRIKTVSWKTHSKVLKEKKVPDSYKVTASLGLISNELSLLEDKKIAPLISRGVLILFTPSKYEIHDHTKGWFLGQNPDQYSKDIYDFFTKNIDTIGTLDMRDYYTARVMARRGYDWRAFLREKLLGWDSRELLAEKLMKDRSFRTNLERYKVFRQRTGKSLSHFNEILTKRELRKLKQDPADAPQLVPFPEPELEMEVSQPVIEEATRPGPEPAPKMELRHPSPMTAEEIRAEQEEMHTRNPGIRMTREEDDRVNALADELNRRAEAAAEEVDSGVEAEPSGDEVGKATTKHPIEVSAEDSAEGSADDLNEEPAPDGTAEESAPAKKHRTRRSRSVQLR